MKPVLANRDNDPLRWILACLVLVAVTVFTFWPVVRCEFIHFDDPDYVTDNDWVKRGVTWTGMLEAFQDVQTGNWHPMTGLSHMLDVQWFGLNPAGHHATSLVFHTANTLLLFLLLWRLTGALWRSAFVALFFALHPLHVESVAWISERKDVLSSFFFLLALWAYARYAQTKSERRKAKGEIRPPASHHPPSSIFYLLSLFLFALGLMSKPMVVTLPFVLLLLDYWPLQRVTSDRWHGARPEAGGRASMSPVIGYLSLLREKIPFFALALISCVVTFCVQAQGGAVTTVDSLPLDARFANAISSYFGYIRKTFWPSDLAVFYPYTGGPQLPMLVLISVLLAGVTVIVVRFAPGRRYLAVGWFWFLGMLVPVIGLVQVGLQSMADRYTYLPLVGLFLAVVWGAGEWAASSRRSRRFFFTLAVFALAGCAVITRRQLQYWQNGVELFNHALAVTPNNALAQYSLGTALVVQGKTEAACGHFAQAVQLHPEHAEALNNLGLCFVLQGDRDAGVDCYRKALAVKPEYLEARYNLAFALAARGDRNGAIEQYREAVRLNPGFPDAHAQLGLALAQEQKFTEAVTHFREALRLRPDAPTHHNFAGTLVLQGDTEGALANYREAVRLKPNWPEPLNQLAWLLATHRNPALRNGDEAVRLAEQACVLSGHTNANFLATLAAAYAERGRFMEAVETSARSVGLAIAVRQSEFADAERQRLALYRLNQPFHQE